MKTTSGLSILNHGVKSRPENPYIMYACREGPGNFTTCLWDNYQNLAHWPKRFSNFLSLTLVLPISKAKEKCFE